MCLLDISLQNHAAVIRPKCHIQNYTKFLHLNKSKTEMILLGQPKRVRRVSTTGLLASSCHLVAMNLGVIPDCALTFDKLISCFVKTCFVQSGEGLPRAT